MLGIVKKINYITCILSCIFINYLLFIIYFNDFLIKLNFIFFILFCILFFFDNKDKHLLFLLIFFLLLISLGTVTTSWDARSIHIFRAKQIFLENKVLFGNDSYSKYLVNVSYPNFASAFVAGFAKLIGHWNEIYPKSALTLMYIPPLIIISNYFQKNLLLIAYVFIIFVVGKNFVNGELDGLVAVYFSSAALMLFNKIENSINKFKLNLSDTNLFLIITLLSFLKHEAIFLSFLLIFISNIILITSKINLNKFYLLYFSIFPVLLYKLYWYLSQIDPIAFNLSYIYFLNKILILDNYIYLFQNLILNEKFFLGVLIFPFSSYLYKKKEVLKFCILITILYLLLLSIVYFSSSLDFNWHINASATRVVKSISLFLFVFGLLNINKFFQSNNIDKKNEQKINN